MTSQWESILSQRDSGSNISHKTMPPVIDGTCDRIMRYIVNHKMAACIKLDRKKLKKLRFENRCAAIQEWVSFLVDLHFEEDDQKNPFLIYQWDHDETILKIYTFHKKYIHLSCDEVDKIMVDYPDFLENMNDLDRKYHAYWGWGKDVPWYH